MNTKELNERFTIKDEVEFSDGNGGLPIVTINNKFATSVISLYGGQVLSYQPVGGLDVLWMSDKSVFEEGKPIRGGIPLCFPWFGPHASDTSLPQHGFARLVEWNVSEVLILANGATKLILSLHYSAATKKYWPYEFSAMLTVTVGPKLEVKLTVINIGEETFTYSDALHSYFNISDINEINIDGLRSASYYEGASTELNRQEEPLLQIAKEENRRYVGSVTDCIIYDKQYRRKIRIAKTDSKVTVVWNPGAENAKNIADIGEDGHKHFVCIEAVNAYDDVVTLASGQEFTLSTIIGAQ